MRALQILVNAEAERKVALTDGMAKIRELSESGRSALELLQNILKTSADGTTTIEPGWVKGLRDADDARAGSPAEPLMGKALLVEGIKGLIECGEKGCTYVGMEILKMNTPVRQRILY